LRLQSKLLDERVNRDSLVVALGGGVIGDLAGFVAATVLRGIQYVQVPTTLLAQVDSSVGGKVGVDHRLGKNMIGAFHQPSAVFIDPVLLRTLPDVEYRNGIAEIVKIAAGLDRSFFSFLERNVSLINVRDVRVVSILIARAVGLKAAVVARDEFEQGLRKVLNLGHTIGHALEAATGYSMKHGLGVSMGVATEAKLAVRLGMMKEQECVRLTTLLSNLGLPVRIPRGVNAKKFATALAHDKKSDSLGTTFVLPTRIGKCVIGARVPRSVLRDVMGNSTATTSR
jgi:3-dehydroquinate synthase